jgi:hypothetical protein
MPKILDYPRGSLKTALELADAVDALGGEASIEMAADKLGRKVSGAFSALTSSANKYGLIDSKSQRMSVTALYRDYKLAYSPEEEKSALRTALLKPPIFQSIVDRFANRALPLTHFEKLLEREFGVPNDWASRVASYFIDGARDVGLLGDGNIVLVQPDGSSATDSRAEEEQELNLADEASAVALNQVRSNSIVSGIDAQAASEHYVITISGPSINTTIRVLDEDDFAILQATLRKVEKAISTTE